MTADSTNANTLPGTGVDMSVSAVLSGEKGNRKSEEREVSQKPWKMPDWMEQYRVMLAGDRTEALYNGRTSVQINAPLALMELALQAEVDLMIHLHEKGLLKDRTV